MKAMKTIYSLGRLDSDASALAWVNQCFREGQEENAFPSRPTPDGQEQCLIFQHSNMRWAGFCTFYWIEEGDKRKLWIDLIYVLPEFRRLGIGAKLLKHVARLNSDVEIMLGTAMTNMAMQALALENGFFHHHLVLSTRTLEFGS